MNDDIDRDFENGQIAPLQDEIYRLKRRVVDIEEQRNAAMKTLQTVEALLIVLIDHMGGNQRIVGEAALIKGFVAQEWREIDSKDIPF